MNKKLSPESVSQEEALRAIKNAQKRSSNQNYDDWCSPKAKSELGDFALKTVRKVIAFFAFFICLLALTWFVALVYIACVGQGNAKGAEWLMAIISDLSSLFFFKICPAIATFFVGKIWGKNS